MALVTYEQAGENVIIKNNDVVNQIMEYDVRGGQRHTITILPKTAVLLRNVFSVTVDDTLIAAATVELVNYRSEFDGFFLT